MKLKNAKIDDYLYQINVLTHQNDIHPPATMMRLILLERVFKTLLEYVFTTQPT
jgi:hypothetical protein